MSTMLFERVALATPPCHTHDMARMQAVKVVMDSAVLEGAKDAAAELDTAVSVIVDEALRDWLARWRLGEGRRGVDEYFAENPMTPEELAEAETRWQEREREIEAFFADGEDAAE
jgi:phosphopantothenoylcysteine synthetase/decarboxylase